MSFLAATFASAGYVVMVPDGIGFGSTKERQHPYVHASWPNHITACQRRQFTAASWPPRAR